MDAVDHAADAVIDPAEQVGTDRKGQRLAAEPHPRAAQIEAGGGFQHLDRQHLLVERGHAPEPRVTVAADHLDRLVQPDIDRPPQEQQRSLDTCRHAIRKYISPHFRTP